MSSCAQARACGAADDRSMSSLLRPHTTTAFYLQEDLLHVSNP